MSPCRCIDIPEVTNPAPAPKKPILSKYIEEGSLEHIVRTLVLRFVALTSGYSPNGNSFENVLATELANFITPKPKAMTF